MNVAVADGGSDGNRTPQETEQVHHSHSLSLAGSKSIDRNRLINRLIVTSGAESPPRSRRSTCCAPVLFGEDHILDDVSRASFTGQEQTVLEVGRRAPAQLTEEATSITCSTTRSAVRSIPSFDIRFDRHRQILLSTIQCHRHNLRPQA